MWEDFSSLIYLATYILDLRVVSIRRNSDSEAELDSPTWLDLGFLTKKQKVKKFGGDPLFFFVSITPPSASEQSRWRQPTAELRHKRRVRFPHHSP